MKRLSKPVPAFRALLLAVALWPIPTSPGFAETDLQRDGLRGAVREVSVAYAPAGKDSRPVEKALYDLRGNRVRRTVYERNGKINNRTESVFDSAGRKIEQSVRDDGNRLLSRQTWKYDPAGRLTEQRLLNDAGREILVERWSFDSAGRLLQKERKAPQRPQENQTVRRSYNDTGKPLSKTRFDHEDIPFQKRTFIYRENGNLRREIVFRSDRLDGTTVERIVENRAYDKDGRLTDTTLFSPEGDFLRRWSYRYDASGNKTEQSLYLKPGKIESQWMHRYNSGSGQPEESRYLKNGKTVLVKSFKDDGSGIATEGPAEDAVWKREEKMDERGNWTQKTLRKRDQPGESFESVGVYTRAIKYFPQIRE